MFVLLVDTSLFHRFERCTAGNIDKFTRNYGLPTGSSDRHEVDGSSREFGRTLYDDFADIPRRRTEQRPSRLFRRQSAELRFIHFAMVTWRIVAVGDLVGIGTSSYMWVRQGQAPTFVGVSV